MAIRAILFDYGNVLGGAGPAKTNIAQALGVETIIVDAAWARTVPRYQTGGFVTEQTFWQAFCDIAATTPPDLREGSPWLAGLEQSCARYAGSFDLVESMKRAGLKVGILSNTIPLHAEYNRSAGRFDDFEPQHVTLSCEIGVRKPDLEAFRHAIKRLDVGPLECVFVDDSEIYVNAARRIGMSAIQFDRERQTYKVLEDELKNLGVAVD